MPVRASILTALILACLIPVADARPRFRARRTPRRPSWHVPWQTIAAGGIATSAVVFAYKVADGIGEGIRTAASTEPQGFLQEAAGTGRTFQFICVACLLASCAYLAWRLKLIRIGSSDPSKPPDRQQESEPPRPSE